MANVANFQTLVPFKDANDIVTSWVLRTVTYNDSELPAANVYPKSLVRTAPWNLKSFTIISTP